jgi:phytoene/squalene synthetase
LKFWKKTSATTTTAPAPTMPMPALPPVAAVNAKANFLRLYLEAEQAGNSFVAQKAMKNAAVERARQNKDTANAALAAAQLNAQKSAQNTASAIARRNAYAKAASDIAQAYANHTKSKGVL